MKLMKKGFTLIELLVVIGILAILMAIVLVAVNPGRQFASARNTERQAHLHEITSAIYQFASQHNGNLPATTFDANGEGNFPTAGDCDSNPASGTAIGTSGFNLAAAGAREASGAGPADTDLIVSTYIAAVPEDPSTGSAADTGYTICLDSDTGRITARAPDAELGATIEITR